MWPVLLLGALVLMGGSKPTTTKPPPQSTTPPPAPGQSTGQVVVDVVRVGVSLVEMFKELMARK